MLVLGGGLGCWTPLGRVLAPQPPQKVLGGSRAVSHVCREQRRMDAADPASRSPDSVLSQKHFAVVSSFSAFLWQLQKSQPFCVFCRVFLMHLCWLCLFACSIPSKKGLFATKPLLRAWWASRLCPEQVLPTKFRLSPPISIPAVLLLLSPPQNEKSPLVIHLRRSPRALPCLLCSPLPVERGGGGGSSLNSGN